MRKDFNGPMRQPMARKDHKCDMCGQNIPKGTRYISWCGIVRGDFFKTVCHLECREATQYWTYEDYCRLGQDFITRPKTDLRAKYNAHWRNTTTGLQLSGPLWWVACLYPSETKPGTWFWKLANRSLNGYTSTAEEALAKILELLSEDPRDNYTILNPEEAEHTISKWKHDHK